MLGSFLIVFLYNKIRIMDRERIETAIFANGCFWCSEAIFQRINGVKLVVPGYIGGVTDNPTYDEVCSGGSKTLWNTGYCIYESDHDRRHRYVWRM